MEIVPFFIKMFAVGMSIGIVYGVIILVALQILNIFDKSTR